MKTITISLSDTTADETVTAEYFQIEDGWITFKTEDHKAVVAYPEKRVTRIKSEEDPRPTNGVRVNAAAFIGDSAAKAREDAAKIAARWAGRS